MNMAVSPLRRRRMTEQQFQQEGRRLDGEFAMAQRNQQLRALASRRTGTMPGMSSTLAGYQRMTGPNPAGMASVPAEGVSAAPQASPMRQGPLYGQQSYQNVELAPVNAYGLRRNPGNLEARAPGDSNFVPDQLAPVGPGLIGSMRTDGARVYRTPSGGHRLVGTPTDPEALAALRTSQAEAGEKRRATGLVNRQQREAEASFLRAKRMGLPTESGVAKKLGADPGGRGLTLADRSKLLNPQTQDSLRATLGFSPATDNPRVVLDSAINTLEALDPNDTEGRNAVMQGVRAARGRQDFHTPSAFGDYGELLPEVDALLADPDEYLKNRKVQKRPLAQAPPSVPSTRSAVPGTYYMPSPR